MPPLDVLAHSIGWCLPLAYYLVERFILKASVCSLSCDKLEIALTNSVTFTDLLQNFPVRISAFTYTTKINIKNQQVKNGTSHATINSTLN
ncbi:MAG: hypothetical protein CMK64_14360 [Pseudoalteromonas sp.]|nr:hypothetical protein [Pseudoalteromonas sp.]|tara:strand:+ start:2735 stop:3007 length:273 start_codon:yes stop_codon:yes gene_type:complete